MPARANVRGAVIPRYRHQLKGAIHSAGYQHIKEFCLRQGMSNSRLSRILGGWEWPSPRNQKALAEGLGVNIRDLQNYL